MSFRRRFAAVGMMMLSGVVNLIYLVRDEFTTDESAPITDPRIAEPGPGSLDVEDGSNIMAVNGGVLRINGNPAADSYLDAGQLNFQGGRCFGVTITPTSISAQRLRIGNGDPGQLGLGTMIQGIRYQSTTSVAAIHSSTALIQPTIGAGPHEFRFILYSSAGGYTGLSMLTLVKAAADEGFTLLWPASSLAVAGFNPIIYVQSGGTTNVLVDDFIVRDLGGAAGQIKGLATDYRYLFDDPEMMSQTNDAVIFISWQPKATGSLTVLFRRTDDDNCLKLVCDRVGGTIKLYERIAGVDTELDAGKTQAWGGSADVIIHMNGSAIRTMVGLTLKHNTTTTILTGTTVKTSGTVGMREVVIWPLTGIADPLLNQSTRTSKTFMGVGDSTANGGTYDDPLSAGYGGYQPILRGYLENASGFGWQEDRRIAHPGYTVAQGAAAIDADLAAKNAYYDPDYIFVDYGLNTIGAGMDEEALATDYAYIIDALHTKWPNARVYCTRIWKNGFETYANIFDDEILPSIVATRASWAGLGIDKRDILNLTNSPDGTHQNFDGYKAIAAAWQAFLGY